jgi:UPF0755 protein
MTEPDNQGNSGQGRFTLRSPREALQPSAPPPAPVPPSSAYRRRGGIVSKISGFLTFVLIAGIIGYVCLGLVRQQLAAPGPLTADKSVVIPRNSGFTDAADILVREGVIKDALWFRIATSMRGGQLQAGEFMITKNASLQQVVNTLVAGKTVDRKITIPEGLTSQQIVERVRNVDFLTGDVTTIPPEGSLLPDTYQVDRNTTRDAFLARMQRDQKRMLDRIWASRVEGLPVKSPEELVVLASIVEKETAVADERSRVAAVYINRLNTLTGDFVNAAGRKEPPMTLDSDPTVIYGITKGSGVLGRGLLRSELQDETNVYNTYRRRGLPPGPIANPGRAAMEAVANPSKTSDLYFVADGTGGHVFAVSLNDHNKNVARWRKIEAEKIKAAEEAAKAAPASGETPADTPAGEEPKPDPQKQGSMDQRFLPDEWPHRLLVVEALVPLIEPLQLAQALNPPKAAEFDGVPSYPVPDRMRRKKGATKDKLEGTVEPRMADNPEASVPESERTASGKGRKLKPRQTAVRSRGVRDASAGSKYDPLKLKNYDINSDQTIPRL